MDGYRLYAEIEKVVTELGGSVHYKPESRLMKLIGEVLFFNKTFMTSYTTTIGRRIYFPRRFTSESEHLRKACTLAHECVHVDDYSRHRIVFPLSYLFPQVLALLSLLAFGVFFHLAFLWALLFLVFLLPIPSPGRREAELRGYAISMAMSYWVGRRTRPDYTPYIPIFTGSGYYYMWPFERDLQSRFEKLRAATENDTLHTHLPLAQRLKAGVEAASSG